MWVVDFHLRLYIIRPFSCWKVLIIPTDSATGIIYGSITPRWGVMTPVSVSFLFCPHNNGYVPSSAPPNLLLLKSIGIRLQRMCRATPRVFRSYSAARYVILVLF